MSDLEKAGSSLVRPAPPLRTWDVMETLFVALVADGVFLLTSGLTLLAIVVTHPGAASMSSAQLHALWTQGNLQGAGLIAASLPTIAVLWVAIRKARRGFAEYMP